jgi:tol-pal system protein YbgF
MVKHRKGDVALKKHWISVLLAAAWFFWGISPAFAVSRQTIEMMQQLDTLQQEVQTLQTTLATQTAILKTLIQQTQADVKTIKQQVTGIRRTTAQSLANYGSSMQTLTGQVQALGSSVDEANARLAKLSDQLIKTQNIIQTLNQVPAAPATNSGLTPASGSEASPTNAGMSPPGGAGNAATDTAAPPAAALPGPNALFSSALSSYNGGQYGLAIQGFEEYLQYYGNSARAADAQYYIGDSYYNEGNYPKAVVEFNKCLDRYQSGRLLPTAQLKKAYALLNLGETQAAIRELRSLIQRYPHSSQADLARQRLKALYTPPTRRR